jgi:hypothetical protein
MELIKKWLSGNRNYIVGAVLYKKFGSDEKLKKLFESRPDAYSQKRLVEELTKMADNKRPPVAPLITDHSSRSEMPQSKDPVLKALRNEWLVPYKRMCYLQAELDRVTTDDSFPLYDVNDKNSPEAIAKRKPIAFEILELEQQCMQIWARRSHYEKNGSLPEVKEQEEAVPTDPVELGKLIEATKRNIRRNKQLTETHPGNTIYPLKQRQYETKLERIMKNVNHGEKPA